MGVKEANADATPAAEAAVPPLRHRRLIAVSVAGAILALVVLGLVLRLNKDDDPPEIESRQDPVADLLVWIPADEVTRAAFSVWTPDTGLVTPVPATESFALADRLSLDPAPRVLGRSTEWIGRYGWSASQVTAWAVAGIDSELTVLDGQFDRNAIDERLRLVGYTRAEYGGADLYIGGESSNEMSAIAIRDGRLIVSSSDVLVRLAIDVAITGEGSLADDPTIAMTLRSMAPLSALTAVDQARHAALCAPDLVAANQSLSGNYVAVGYGRLGVGQERRTLIATTFVDEAAATAALLDYESGWISGFANAGGMGGSVDAFGELTVVSRTANLLMAEMVKGRDDGWVRSGIRFAIPVCEAALAIAPATPAPAAVAESVPTMERLAGSLPETGGSGVYRAFDLSEITAARGLSAPGAGPTADQVDSWLGALRPLPAFAIAPLSARALIAWSDAFRVPISAIHGLAETHADAQGEPVGVMMGTWDLEVLTATLQNQGYEWIELGDVRHFAPRRTLDASPPLMAGAGGAWENIAVLGDRIWFSSDQRAMRSAVDEAIGEQAPERDLAIRQVLLGVTGNVTAVEMSGVNYLSRRGCGALLPGVAAIGAAWTANAAGESAAIAYLPDGAVSEPGLVQALDQRVTTMTLTVGAVGSGSPVPSATVSLSGVLGYLGTESASSTAGNAIVARFTVPDRERVAGLRFFEGTTGGCALTRVG